MAQNAALRKSLEDALLGLEIGDFSGGLQSNADIQDLPLNASPDCENVLFLPGRIRGRKGYLVRAASRPADADGGFFFYDTAGTRWIVEFNNGNLYTMADDYTVTLRVSSVYTAGNRVTATVLNGILYFSDGETILTGGATDTGIRYYDPVSDPAAAPGLLTAGGGSTIPTPACKVLRTYAGSLVLGNIKYVGGTYARDSILWSNVNDPTTINGTNIFRIGAGQGGEINSIEPMGISSVGISPFRALFVGKTVSGVFLLTGALSVSDLSEKILNAPVGVLDGASVKFIPGPDGSGLVLWLGTDNLVWYTNGVQSDVLSRPISRELSTAIQDRLTLGQSKFRAVRNFADYLYILDIGPDATGQNVHYVYDWDQRLWTRFKGWPTGYWIEAKDSSSQYVIYCCDESSRIVEANVGSQDGSGGTITKYWKSCYLRGDADNQGNNAGDAEIWKLWKWIYASFRTDDGSLTVTATVNLGFGASATVTLTPDSFSSGAALVWDSGTWDTTVWASAGAILQPPYKLGKRLAVDTDISGDVKGPLGGYDIQLTVSDTTDSWFEVLSLKLLYLPKGRRRVVA